MSKLICIIFEVVFIAILAGCASTNSRAKTLSGITTPVELVEEQTADDQEYGSPLAVVDAVAIMAPDRDLLAKCLGGDGNRIDFEPVTDGCSIAIDAIARALSRYPPDFVRSYVQYILVVDCLRLRQISYGGTYKWGVIVLVVRGEQGRIKSSKAIEFALHHELSSLILHGNANAFSSERWAETNPASFQYLEGGSVGALKSGASEMKGSMEVYESGFLFEYSKASIEEDFNNTAAAIMLPLPGIEAILTKYEGIRRKAELVVTLYAHADSRFGMLFMSQDFLKHTPDRAASQNQ